MGKTNTSKQGLDQFINVLTLRKGTPAISFPILQEIILRFRKL